jgi:hypothetical protein
MIKLPYVKYKDNDNMGTDIDVDDDIDDDDNDDVIHSFLLICTHKNRQASCRDTRVLQAM